MRNKKALLIIDMLNDFVLEGAPLEVSSARAIILPLKKEIEKTKNEGIPVIYVHDNHEKDDREFVKMGWPVHAVKGTKGAEVIEDLKPLKEDIIIEKATYSSFYNTKLDEILKKLEVNTLRLTGILTNVCILFTASDGVLRGYDVEVPKNCVAGQNKEDEECALRLMSEVLGAKII